MSLSFTVLGSNAAVPAAGRLPSSHLLNVNEKYYLLDCGEGCQLQLRKYHIKTQRIQHIFISHLHGDHYYGLIGLLTTMHLLSREKPLHIYSPPGLKEIIDLQFSYSKTQLAYPVNYIEFTLPHAETLLDDENLRVSTLPMVHSIPCWGFLFEEKGKLRSIIKEALGKYKIPVSEIQSIKEGADFMDASGNRIPNSEITTTPPAPQRFAYCTDTAYNESLIPMIRDVDMLYHEATFDAGMQQRAKETLHSTTADAANMALKSGAKKLIAGHLSARYKNTDGLSGELRGIFENSSIAQEGREYFVD
ncbi:MAG: ribonuclease Z [Flavobacteriales bacterium]